MRPDPRPADEAGIAAAVDALSRGRLILHPTETVVSLSCDPRNDRAVASVHAVKGYRSPRPFLCLVPGIEGARALAREWPDAAERLAEAFWPGPLTLVVPASPDAPAAVVERGAIAVRPAADPVSCALMAAWKRPLLSTSANRRGESPAADVSRALAGLAPAPGADAIEVVLAPSEPAEPAGPPSTIIDVCLSPPRLLRSGAIPAARVRAVVGELAEGGT